jgi:hypothetical protein
VTASKTKIRHNIDLKETGTEDVDWCHLVQDKVQYLIPLNNIINIIVP